MFKKIIRLNQLIKEYKLLAKELEERNEVTNIEQIRNNIKEWVSLRNDTYLTLFGLFSFLIFFSLMLFNYKVPAAILALISYMILLPTSKGILPKVCYLTGIVFSTWFLVSEFY